MGYYTDFELEVDTDIENLVHVMNAASGYGWEGEDEDSCFMYGVKWYDYPEDMLKLSREYPKVLFTLRGVGEEQPDIWVHFFKNGIMSGGRAAINYPEYNEEDHKGEVEDEPKT